MTTIELIGDRLPSPCRTGAGYISAGDSYLLKPGFCQADMQALDAPRLLPKGSTYVICTGPIKTSNGRPYGNLGYTASSVRRQT